MPIWVKKPKPRPVPGHPTPKIWKPEKRRQETIK